MKRVEFYQCPRPDLPKKAQIMGMDSTGDLYLPQRMVGDDVVLGAIYDCVGVAHYKGQTFVPYSWFRATLAAEELASFDHMAATIRDRFIALEAS